MFLYLSKLLPLFIYPIGLVSILIAAALAAARWRKVQRILLLAALLVLLVGGNRWVADSLTRSLEWRYLTAGDIPKAEAIVLLGGGTQSADYPRRMVELNSAGDRVLYAAQLFHQGKAEHILLSGGNLDWNKVGSTPAEEMASVLEMLQVPASALWLEADSRNTYENAVNSRAILTQQGIDHVILVTSALHMPRAVALFEHQGIQAIPAPADFRVTQADWEQLKSAGVNIQLSYLIPSAENLSQTTGALKEYLGLLVYKLRGWL
jgi:uncharacterized SAM-binding protein YcdF (DUF218 family)